MADVLVSWTVTGQPDWLSNLLMIPQQLKVKHSIPLGRMKTRCGAIKSFPKGPKGSPFRWNEPEPLLLMKRLPESSLFIEDPAVSPFFFISLTKGRCSSLIIKLLSSFLLSSPEDKLDGNRLSLLNRPKVLPLIPFFLRSLSPSIRSSIAADVTLSSFFLSSSRAVLLCLGKGALAKDWGTNGSAPSTPARRKCNCKNLGVRSYTPQQYEPKALSAELSKQSKQTLNVGYYQKSRKLCFPPPRDKGLYLCMKIDLISTRKKRKISSWLQKSSTSPRIASASLIFQERRDRTIVIRLHHPDKSNKWSHITYQPRDKL